MSFGQNLVLEALQEAHGERVAKLGAGGKISGPFHQTLHMGSRVGRSLTQGV